MNTQKTCKDFTVPLHDKENNVPKVLIPNEWIVNNNKFFEHQLKVLLEQQPAKLNLPTNMGKVLDKFNSDFSIGELYSFIGTNLSSYSGKSDILGSMYRHRLTEKMNLCEIVNNASSTVDEISAAESKLITVQKELDAFDSYFTSYANSFIALD